MEKFIKNKSNAIILSIIAMLLWGSAIPLIKTTYSYLQLLPNDTGSKIYVAGIRFLLAGIITFVYFIFFNKEKILWQSINFKFILCLLLVQTSVQYIFYYIGLAHTLGTKASIIQSSNAFFIVIISSILIKDEKLTLKKLIALAIGTIGIIIVNIGKSSDFTFTLYGEGFILIATIFNALATVIVRKYGKNQNSFIISSFQFLIGSIPLIIIGYVSHKTILNFDFKIMLMLIYGGFISATAFTLWTMILKEHSSGEFSVYKLFIPIFGTILSIIFLGELFTVKIILGLMFVLIGSFIINRD